MVFERIDKSMEVISGLWYLAGPFFNPIQKAWAEKIRDLVIDADRHYYSPIEDMFQDGIQDKEKADKVFQANVVNLLHASVVLCQLDWLLEEDQELRLMDNSKWDEYALKPLSGPLNIPDSGTVWEMGYATALRDIINTKGKGNILKPIVVGYFSKKSDKLNLMLARSCDAFFNGEKQLTAFIKSGKILPIDVFQGKEI